jgi:hypothetical protein
MTYNLDQVRTTRSQGVFDANAKHYAARTRGSERPGDYGGLIMSRCRSVIAGFHGAQRLLFVCAFLCCSATSGFCQNGDHMDFDEYDVGGTTTTYDNACTNLAWTLAGEKAQRMETEKIPEWIRLCNDHPDTKLCSSTLKRILEKRGAVPPGLTCVTTFLTSLRVQSTF